MIEFKHVSCRFTHASGSEIKALNDVSLSITDGEFLCLLGRSGHGKSTLVRALAGLQSLGSGEILLDGVRVDGPGFNRGMVFQEDTVFPWLSVRDNIEFGLKARGVPKAQRREIAMQWLSAVGLADFASSWPRQLSGGMRKRVAIATVFANDAPVLLMDEPFGPLDYVTRRDLQDLLIELWQKTKKTIVFVTHDIEEALLLADRVLMVRTGRIAEDIRLAELPRPRNEDVRASPAAVDATKAIQRHLALNMDWRSEQALVLAS
jgi:NitT/TauT family transport system ATP-binding protein